MRSAIVWPSPEAVKRSVVFTAWFCITATAPNAAATTTPSSAVAIDSSTTVWPRASRSARIRRYSGDQLTTTVTGVLYAVVAAPDPLTA